jgi:hypothetical protein
LEGSKDEGDCGEGDGDLKFKVGGKLWKRARPESWWEVLEESYTRVRKTSSGETRAREATPILLGFAPGQVGQGKIRFSVIKKNTVNGVKYWDSLSPLSQKWYLNREWTQGCEFIATCDNVGGWIMSQC